MKKISLVCVAGVSSARFIDTIQRLLSHEETNYYIVSTTLDRISNECVDSDLIILSPQVRYNFLKIKEIFPDKIVVLLDNAIFETLDANAFLELVNQYL